MLCTQQPITMKTVFLELNLNNFISVSALAFANRIAQRCVRFVRVLTDFTRIVQLLHTAEAVGLVICANGSWFDVCWQINDVLLIFHMAIGGCKMCMNREKCVWLTATCVHKHKSSIWFCFWCTVQISNIYYYICNIRRLCGFTYTI